MRVPTPLVPEVTVNRVTTPPKHRATSTKYRVPLKSATIYNSDITKGATNVPSQMVIEKKTVYKHQKTDVTYQTTNDHRPADRRWVVAELKHMRIDVADQQVELATMRMKLDNIIKCIDL